MAQRREEGSRGSQGTSRPWAPTAGGSLPGALRDEIKGLIAAQALRPGDRLPSESELMRTYGVGRTTVREAYRLLEQDGVVRSRQGRGRFVTVRPPLRRPLTALEGVTEMMASRGLVPHNRVLDVRLDEPTAPERQALQLGGGATVVRLDRLRTHERDAVIYSNDVFDRALIPRPIAEVDWTGSLFDLLAGVGRPISYCLTEVRAVVDPAVAERAGEAAGTPWLLLVQEHADAEGRPVLLSKDYHRGSDFSFDVQRVRPR